MCMAGAEILATVPLATYFIVMNLTSTLGVQPYKGWADTHSYFNRVDQFPAILWRSDPKTARALEMARWLVVVCAAIFFIFFGFADEARKHYRLAFQTLVKTVGLSTVSSSSGLTSSNGYVFLSTVTSLPPNISRDTSAKSKGMRSFGKGSLPVFVRRQTTTKQESDGSSSFDEKLSSADAGGALADYKQDPYTLTEFSGTFSTTETESTIPSPDDDYSITLPEPPSLARPEPALDLSTVPRHLPHHSIDMA
jgi:pheromone a factor receptor